MAWTVKKVAALSGVSVRTLHFYDEMGLLKPAYCGANGYRYYEDAQLLMLQQILFYRELGFELKQIKRMLNQPRFDKVAALESHRRILRRKLERTQELLSTIDKTIAHLKGKKKMKTTELFAGFNPEQQAKHEEYLVNRYGESMKASIAWSKQKVSAWTKADWERSGAAFQAICRSLAELLEQGKAADSQEVQAVVRRHFEWLKQFWTPTRESYTGHSQMIVDSELRKPYETFHPRLPEFVAEGIRAFAQTSLA